MKTKINYLKYSNAKRFFNTRLGNGGKFYSHETNIGANRLFNLR